MVTVSHACTNTNLQSANLKYPLPQPCLQPPVPLPISPSPSHLFPNPSSYKCEHCNKISCIMHIPATSAQECQIDTSTPSALASSPAPIPTWIIPMWRLHKIHYNNFQPYNTIYTECQFETSLPSILHPLPAPLPPPPSPPYHFPNTSSNKCEHCNEISWHLPATSAQEYRFVTSPFSLPTPFQTPVLTNVNITQGHHGILLPFLHIHISSRQITFGCEGVRNWLYQGWTTTYSVFCRDWTGTCTHHKAGWYGVVVIRICRMGQ